jgi:Xaa-Pro aminopeptidase
LGAVVAPLFAPAVRARLAAVGACAQPGPTLDEAGRVRTHTDWIEAVDIRGVVRGDNAGDSADDGVSAAQAVERAWSAAGRPAGFARPAAFDARAAFRELGDLLRDEGLAGARIGLDLDFWPVPDFACLQQCLPDVEWVDASATIGRIRAVKAPAEIERLRVAAALAEAGMRAALAMMRAGVTREAIAQAWSDGVAEQARRDGVRPSGQWEYISVGPLPWQTAGVTAQRGDIVKFDVGCLIEGCSSDCGRTFSIGQASPRARQIMAALEDAFASGLEALKPGMPLREVHARAMKAMHRHGFARFARGHFGHSLGLDTFCEVPPFIAAQADDLIEPGMVLAFETPFYVDGEGGFIIEDQFLITEDGAQAAWSLQRGLVEVPA